MWGNELTTGIKVKIKGVAGFERSHLDGGGPRSRTKVQAKGGKRWAGYGIKALPNEYTDKGKKKKKKGEGTRGGGVRKIWAVVHHLTLPPRSQKTKPPIKTKKKAGVDTSNNTTNWLRKIDENGSWPRRLEH